MQNTDPVEIVDIDNSAELSAEQMAEVKGGRNARADERKSGELKTYHPSDFKTSTDTDSKTSGITTERILNQ